VALEAFASEDHFEAVAGPLLATPSQHTQAAASTSAQVSGVSSTQYLLLARLCSMQLG